MAQPSSALRIEALIILDYISLASLSQPDTNYLYFMRLLWKSVGAVLRHPRTYARPSNGDQDEEDAV